MNKSVQLARFLLVGGIATFMQYCVLFILVQSGATGAVIASGIGFLLSR